MAGFIAGIVGCGAFALNPTLVTVNVAPVAISMLNLSSQTFVAGTAGAFANASAMLSGGSFTGSFSLRTTGSDHSGTACTSNSVFSINGAGVLSVTSSGLAQPYPGVCVVATQAGVSNSPYVQAFTITGGTASTSSVINPNNPVSAATITDGAGATWSFDKSGGAPTTYQGDWPILRNSVSTNPASGSGWQLKNVGGTMYTYSMRDNNWYQWSGSAWSSFGSAPPVSGPGIPHLVGAFWGDSNTFSWFSRYPDTAGGSPSGITNNYSLGITIPTNISYAANICQALTTYYCNTQYFPDWKGIACGAYDSTIINQIQSSLVPAAPFIYYVRVNHEWEGNFQQASPYYGGGEGSSLLTLSNDCPNTTAETPQYSQGRIQPADWIAGTQHMITMLRTYLINCGTANGCNPNIKIEWDGPYDSLQAQYYPGDAYVDIIGTDDYSGSFSATGSLAGFEYYNSRSDGTLNRGYLLTFAQQHNKPSVWPEWCDNSVAPNEVDGVIVTQYINLFASVQGPGNTGVIASGYWDDGGSGDEGNCDLAKYTTTKRAAYAAAWPNGFGGSNYNGTYWLQQATGALIPISPSNPWGAP
jgi:hypothetical protein